MRKFSKILALLLAVSLVGGIFALTTSAEGENTLAFTDKSYATYFDGKISINATKSTNFASQDGTVSGNMLQSNTIFNFATISAVSGANSNQYLQFVKPTGITKSGTNCYLFISTSFRGVGNTILSSGYSEADNLKENVVVLDFDIMGIDVDEDGVADWSTLGFVNFNVATTAGKGATKSISSYPSFAKAFGNTPNVWHHVTIIGTYDAEADRTHHYLYVDGVYAGVKSVNSAMGSATAVVANYLTVGIAKDTAGVASDAFWGFGIDNVVVNSYPNTYADETTDNTLAKMMATGAYKTIGVGNNAPLSAYSDVAYYTDRYSYFDPNPAVATVDGVKYTTLDAALANLTDGKTLVTELPIENYTPAAGVTKVMIDAPSVTLSEDAKAAGYLTATWKDTEGNDVAVAVCQAGTEVTHPVFDGTPVPDEQNVYYGWCKSVYGYSASATDVVTEDVVFTPDACVPYEADINGIMYNVNLDTSFDIAVYVPIRYTQNENGKYELATVLPAGFEFDRVTGGSTNEGYVAVGADEEGNVLYSPCYSRRISMRKLTDSYTPVFSFSIYGREFTYTMPAITIGTYAAEVYKNTECGEKDAVLITAMLNYCMGYEYENLTSNGTPSKATFAIYAAVNSKQNNDDPTPGAHHNCACQEKLREYAANAYQKEMGILDGSEYQINDWFSGFTMHVNFNEPSIGVIVDSAKIGSYSTTAGEGLINAYRYTYTNYRGEKVSQINLIKGAAEAGGWDDYITYDGGVMLKCNNIYVLDVIGTVEIELLTCTEVNEASAYDSTFETLDSAKYSVAEYYQWLSTEAAKENAPAEYGLYVQNLIDLYALTKAARDYRIK